MESTLSFPTEARILKFWQFEGVDEILENSLSNHIEILENSLSINFKIRAAV